MQLSFCINYKTSFNLFSPFFLSFFSFHLPCGRLSDLAELRLSKLSTRSSSSLLRDGCGVSPL